MNGFFNSQVAGTPAVVAEATKDNGVTAISLREGILDQSGGFKQAPGIGVLGENSSPWGIGVQGAANDANGVAVNAISTNGTAIAATSDNGTAITATTKNGNFGAPQIVVINNSLHDFSRIRMDSIVGGWDIAVGGPTGVFNIYSLHSNQNVLSATSKGDVTVLGSLHQHSSRMLKNDISNLSGEDALQAVEQLRPVHYTFKHDEDHTRHLGFIAEEVPELVASQDRKTVRPMDIIAVLTAALREQLILTKSLTDRVSCLENEMPHASHS
jgi:Chaperone of endosialidase